MLLRPIPLSDHDLRQMSEEWVSSLTPAQRDELLARALAELRKSRDRLNQSPTNSSKPPSRRAPWCTTSGGNDAASESPGKALMAEAETNASGGGKSKVAASTTVISATACAPAAAAGKPAAKKAGKQVGAKGFGRMQKLVHTEVDEHRPGTCAGCGACLPQDAGQAYTAWDAIDIAEKLEGRAGLLLQVTRHTLFSITDEPHLPLTNNAAEQSLRHWVIARRISMGTRSEAGTRAFALLASVIETCRKRAASSWIYIASVIAAARQGLTVPAMPPIPAGV